jgi:hypothetical protein
VRSVRFHGHNLAARGRSSTTTIGGVLTMVGPAASEPVWPGAEGPGSAAVAVGAGPVFAAGFGPQARTCCPAVVFGRMAPYGESVGGGSTTTSGVGARYGWRATPGPGVGLINTICPLVEGAIPGVVGQVWQVWQVWHD